MDNELSLAELRQAFDVLTDRVTRLEGQAAWTSVQPPVSPAGRLWALEGLRERRAGDPATEAGAVLIVGSLTASTGTDVEWQQGAATADLLAMDWSEQAAAFAALAHAVRLELLRHILNGTQATADLAEIDGLGSTGQLHHHLRQLISAGWLRQTGRGTYEVPPQRVVPLLACLIGGSR